MRAIILAAGAGTRLSPLTNGCPKCLVPMGDRLLVDYQIEALAAAGVDDIVLVVGYEAEQIRAHCGDGARYIDNPDYLNTNSIYSLYLAREELDADTFLFNCDILFHPEAAVRLRDARYANVVAIDKGVERVSGEMNVILDGEGRIRAISKALDPEQTQAQSAQLVRFNAEGARQVRQEIEVLMQQDQKDQFPTSSYGPLIDQGLLYGVDISDLPWTEIDYLADYEAAQEHVLPRLP